MKSLYLDKSVRKQMTHMLIPIRYIECVETREDGDLETEKIHLKTIEGITFLNATKFIVDGKTLAEAIKEQKK